LVKMRPPCDLETLHIEQPVVECTVPEEWIWVNCTASKAWKLARKVCCRHWLQVWLTCDT
jgi:hypothetical protein